MPVYEAYCQDCEIAAEYLRTVDECLNTPACVSCGEKMKKVILSAPKGFTRGDMQAFKSHVDGTMITNRKELEAHNARNNVVCMSEGFSEEKILAGDFGKKEHKLSEHERKQDIHDAIQAVKAGHRPLIGVEE